jgi:hypothetical protein
MTERDDCRKCPEGKVLKDGKCVMPEVNFAALIMSFNTSALCHLGEVAEPGTGKKVMDLELARHTIDTLQLLQEKTKGNLSKDEEELLAHSLYDLKLRYVQKSDEMAG